MPAASSDIEAAFATLVPTSAPVRSLSAPIPFFTSQRDQFVALAARHGIPAIYQWREFAEAGGLMSYGPVSPMHIVRSASTSAGFSREPSRPTCRSSSRPKFELVINLKDRQGARPRRSAAAARAAPTR